MTGSGTLLDPYVIWDVNDLQNIELDLTAYYELGQDIDASATVGWHGGAGFIPIALVGSFTGQLDGKGFKVTELYINRVDASLFNYIELAVISNLGLEDVNITGADDGAALAIGVEDSTIENCYSTGVIFAIDYGAGLIVWCGGASRISNCHSSCSVSVIGDGCTGGGLIAQASENPIIEDCYATGDVDGTGDRTSVGGFIGYTCEEETIRRCYATGNVTADPGVDDRVTAGGFIGFTCRSEKISQCYATGNVTAFGNGLKIGGFIGFNSFDEIIEDCYARGNVTGEDAVGIFKESTGGFVGGCWPDNGSVSRCYSTGVVSGGDFVGGFCGYFERYNGGDIHDCFWDTETSGTLIGIGLENSPTVGVTGGTTAEMKTESTFTDAGWDFVTIWDIDPLINNGYPYFPSVVLPTVTTDPATAVVNNYSTLNGTLDDEGGEACDCGFEWGETIAYGNTTLTESKTTGETFSQFINGLLPNHTYHFRAFATNSEGTGYGADRTFTTLELLRVNRGYALSREEL